MDEQTKRKWAGRLKTLGVTIALLGALAFFAHFTNKHEPWKSWLFWRYAGYWLACACFGLGCLSTGHAIVRRLLPGELPLREQAATSFAVGVFVYYLLVSFLGLFFLYGKAFFFAIPLAMFAIGARGLFRTARRAARHLRRARERGTPSPWWVFPIVIFGVLGFAMVYFAILTPENVQFDSRWKHFALAEQYAVTGGIRRFPEGWTVATNPHLATFVYLWGFLLPTGQLFDRVELAAHLEFFIFVVTTLSTSALVRRLVPGLRTRHAWAARFLFPGVFLYDSSVSGGADHIAALFVVPMFLLVLRGFRDLSWRHASLVSLMVAGAAMTKLTCLLMVIPVAVVVYAVRAGWLIVRPRPGRSRLHALLGPAVALGVGVVATSTFWAKNWVFYGDPIYPSLYKRLTLRPWTEDAADLFVWGYQDHQFWRPTRDRSGVLETLRSLVDFSFDPNDYGRFHGNVPVIGSLFTLLIPALLFYPRLGRRVWGLVASAHVAIGVWYWVHHQDRYLQLLMPWMAAVTAATLVLVWRSGWPARVAASALVAYQIVWGGDVYFIPTHAMAGSPIKKSVDLLAGTYKKDANRLKTYDRWVELGKRIPKGSRVLLHDNHVHLGIAASTVSDWGAWQFGMSYARNAEPAATHALLKEMGVTHVVWEPQKSQGWDSIAGDIVFFNFATRHTVQRTRAGSFELAELPAAPPTGVGVESVLYLGCKRPVKDGLYGLLDLHVPVFGPASSTYPDPHETGAADVLGAKADAIVLETKCQPSIPAELKADFELVAKRKALRQFKKAKELQIWIRKADAAPARAADSSAPDVEEPEANGP